MEDSLRGLRSAQLSGWEVGSRSVVQSQEEGEQGEAGGAGQQFLNSQWLQWLLVGLQGTEELDQEAMQPEPPGWAQGPGSLGAGAGAGEGEGHDAWGSSSGGAEAWRPEK